MIYLHVKIREAINIMSVFNWIKLCSSLLRAEQKLSRQTERERERGVCACWKARPRARAAVPAIFGDEIRFGHFFFREKKVAKGVCNVAKLATPCISISPTTGWAMGQTENTRCVNRTLIKLVPLNGICVNALLTLTALLQTEILYNGI